MILIRAVLYTPAHSSEDYTGWATCAHETYILDYYCDEFVPHLNRPESLCSKRWDACDSCKDNIGTAEYNFYLIAD